MDWGNLITILISSVFSGGLAGIITWRVSIRKGNAEAKKTESEADTIDLKNAQILIEMYKKSIADLTEAHDKQVEVLKREYENLSNSFNSYKESSESKFNKLHESYNKILKLVDNSCNTCEFADDCKKKLKLLTI